MIQISLVPHGLVAGQDCDLDVRLTNTGDGTCTSVVFNLVLPNEFLVLRGGGRIELDRLGAGQAEVRTIRVRPSRAGSWSVRSNNFSFRDRYGHGKRITGFAAELTVAEPDERAFAEPPRVEARLLTTELPFDEWSELRVVVRNTGRVRATDVAVRLDGQLHADSTQWRRLDDIEAGGHTDVLFRVRANQRGRHVPVSIHLRCGEHRVSQDMSIQVSSVDSSTRAKVGILFLSANPFDSERIRVDREVREIRETLMRGRAHDEFEFHDRHAVRSRDLSQALHDCQPTVIHFGCHGTSDGFITLETETGRSAPTPADALARFFEVVSDDVECVIVNACGSATLAEMIAKHVKYAIGMEDSITDRTAISFSIGFYQALAAGHPVPKAYKFGCAQIGLDVPSSTENHLVPRLFTRP